MKRSQPIAVPRTPRCAKGLPVVDGESEHRGKSACDDSQSVPSRHDDKERDEDNDPAVTNDHSVAREKTQEDGAPVRSQPQEGYAENAQGGGQDIGHDDMGVEEHKLARRCNHYRQKGRIPTSEGIRSPAGCDHERHGEEPCPEFDVAGIAADKPERRQNQRGAGRESRRVHDSLCVGRIRIVSHCRGVAVPVGETVGRIEVLVRVGERLSRQGYGLVEEQQRGRNDRQHAEATQNDEPNRVILPGRRQLPKGQRQPARLLASSAQISLFDNRTPFAPTCSRRRIPILESRPHSCDAETRPTRGEGILARCTCKKREPPTAGRSLDTFARGGCMRSVRGHPQHAARRSVAGHPRAAGGTAARSREPASVFCTYVP